VLSIDSFEIKVSLTFASHLINAFLYKSFSKYLFNLINTSLSLIKIVFKLKARPHFPLPESETLIVLGNGPSLRAPIALKSSYFKGKTLLCVNSFSISTEYTVLKPLYYVMLDPGLWRADNAHVADTIDAIASKTTWPLHILVPHEAKKSPRILSLLQNKNVHVHFFNYIVYKGFERIGFRLYKKNIAMPQSQNVLVASLYFAINLGYKNIELFGADHNWHHDLIVNDKNVVCLKHIHFYDSETTVTYKPFYKMMHVQETFRMDEAFFAFAKVFAGYHQIKKYSLYRNAHIVNMTQGSFVDAFDRGNPTHQKQSLK
jgi:hypothetical protein